MKIIGLDVSLTSTGYCVNGQVGAIHSKQFGCERMVEIRDTVAKLTADADAIAIEGFSMGSKNSRAHDIGGLGWVVRIKLFEMGIKYVEIPPTNLKKFALGKGVGSKDEVVSAISAKTGIVFSGKGANDMCDAWVLHEMLATHLEIPSEHKWNKPNLEALTKVDWTPLH